MRFLRDGCARRRELHEIFHATTQSMRKDARKNTSEQNFALRPCIVFAPTVTSIAYRRSPLRETIWPQMFFCLFLLASCAAPAKIATIQKQTALDTLLSDTALASSFAGISVYDPVTKTFLYNYNSDKYFTPASNTKILTCYAAMKYLKHILPATKYYENDTAIYLIPTGDPTLLHPDFKDQPLIRMLQAEKKKIYITDRNWKDKELGSGWSWDDFNDDYMAERNAFPVYGNRIRFIQQTLKGMGMDTASSVSVYSDPEVNWKVRFVTDSNDGKFFVQRDRDTNIFHISQGSDGYKEQLVPFRVNGIRSSLELLRDTIGKEIRIIDHFTVADPLPKLIWSQPVDSVLKPMMYRSDNFFAEQFLLMVSEERLGVMSAPLIIDTLLKEDLADLPAKPLWVDGSGVSRYNLVTPRSFVALLEKMRVEFGMDRIRNIFAHGDTGTLKGYYNKGGDYLFAKTGTLTGVVALSGFLYTRTNRLLIFSVIVNNFKGSPRPIRRKVESFLESLR